MNQLSQGKLKTLKELEGIVKKLKKQGKRIVLANGCFDLLHIGHLRYLEAARRLGDLLIVAVNNDASTRRLKGAGRPLMKQTERVALLAGLQCVDYVIVFSGIIVQRLLLALRPDIHAKGSDYTAESVPERNIVRSYGGHVGIVGGPKVQSTTELIRRIKNL